MSAPNTDKFWEYCAGVGVRSKRLAIRRQASKNVPLTLVASEKIRYGSPVVNVPYRAVLNCQTLRGNFVPPALPSFDKTRRFLTRHGRMSVMLASRLWLAGFLACYRRQMTLCERFDARAVSASVSETIRDTRAEHKNINSALMSSLMPHLLLLTLRDTATIGAPPGPVVTRLSPDEMNEQVHTFHNLMIFHAKRTRVAQRLRPDVIDLTHAHATVTLCGLPLPIHCTPSAPDDLAKLIDENPDMVQLYSLIPIIDLACATSHAQLISHALERSCVPVSCATSIQSMSERVNHATSPTEVSENKSSESGGNTEIYTCVEARYENDDSRRRAIVETSPLSARRVVLCAARDIDENEPVSLLYKHEV